MRFDLEGAYGLLVSPAVERSRRRKVMSKNTPIPGTFFSTMHTEKTKNQPTNSFKNNLFRAAVPWTAFGAPLAPQSVSQSRNWKLLQRMIWKDATLKKWPQQKPPGIVTWCSARNVYNPPNPGVLGCDGPKLNSCLNFDPLERPKKLRLTLRDVHPFSRFRFSFFLFFDFRESHEINLVPHGATQKQQ